MNSPTIGQVDEAVRLVLAALRRGTGPRRRSSVGTFAGRLLGQRQVEELGLDAREIRVAPTTVITPIARDMLKRRGIQVLLVAEGQVSRRGEWGFVLEAELATEEAIRRAIVSAEGDWIELGRDGIEAARWVAGDRDRGAVVLSDQPAVTCWLAAQVAGVRPASPADAEGIARAVDQLGVNLLVIEPAKHSLPSLLHCLKTFRRSGAPEPPSWLDGGITDEDWRGDRPRDLLPAAPERAESAIPRRRPDASGGDHRWLAQAGGGARRA